MTLDQLRIFVAVAERQHVTWTVQVLNLAQSAASAAIVGLEARHEAKLFHRVGRGIELTEVGRLFLGEAKAGLAIAGYIRLFLRPAIRQLRKHLPYDVFGGRRARLPTTRCRISFLIYLIALRPGLGSPLKRQE